MCILPKSSSKISRIRPHRPTAPLPAAPTCSCSCDPTAAAASSCSTTLFPSGWALWTCLAACAALSQVIERRTRIGVYVSSPLLATLLALAAAACGVIPTTAGAYDTIWVYLMPLAAALYLLESDISRLLTSARQSFLAFFNATMGSVVGTVVAFALVGRFMGPDGAKVAGALCASVNFAAVSGLLGLNSGSTLAAAMTADNLAMAVYLAIIMAIPVRLPEEFAEGGAGDSAVVRTAPAVTSETLALALAAGVFACTVGNTLASWAGFASGGLAFTALVASIVATVAGYFQRKLFLRPDSPKSPKDTFSSANRVSSAGFTGFAGSEALGGTLMMFFFATIGAAAGSLGALRGSGWMVMFIAIMLVVQFSITMFLGKVMNIPLALTLLGTNATVGGPATAAAMAGAKGWRNLVQPAVLTGALGYAIANAIGFAMGRWFMTWQFF